MKVLLFSTLYPNSSDPTKGVFVENRIRQLKSYGDVEVKVVAPVPWFPFSHAMFGEYSKYSGVPAIEHRHDIEISHPSYFVLPKVGMHLTPYSLYRAGLKAVKKVIKDGFDFDLIDAHYLYPDGVVASWIAEEVGKPFVMTARGSDVTQIAHIPRPRKLIHAAIEKASKVITVSESLRQDLITQGAESEKIITLRNGVDLEMFTPFQREETRQALGLSRKTIVFAGWLIERKRVDLVISVAAAMPDVDVLILGDGPEYPRLKKQVCDLGVESRVTFVGQKEHNELKAFFSAADILLLPSMREGWPNVLLEAMACGTPVVSTDVGGVREFVCNDAAGRVSKSHEVTDIVDAIEALFDHYPNREDVRLYAEQFSWDATSQGQMEIFSNIISESQAT